MAVGERIKEEAMINIEKKEPHGNRKKGAFAVKHDVFIKFGKICRALRKYESLHETYEAAKVRMCDKCRVARHQRYRNGTL